eukprot:TRINITY_DN9536_c0_g1_i1.p1 TRINITY_DN9536_c0_g1~~TRINITY_DN9536_c0_g1_i1.p1  ORF type:complete len:361 (-),score=89.17 TRINITY_DN9536_c0_g1_i1:56-1138(-)
MDHGGDSNLEVEDIRVRVCLGLAAGDSLGSTSEFEIPWNVTKNCIDVHPGWPRKQVGGGKHRTRVGEATDDTHLAIRILRGVKESGHFDGKAVLNHYLEWKTGNPIDIGATTAWSLATAQRRRSEDSFLIGGLGEWRKNPNNLANGSLMRNGVIAALFPKPDQETEAIDATILQGAITHYAPLPVLCCVIHTILIRCGINKQMTGPASIQDIQKIINGPWRSHLDKTQDPDVISWRDTIGRNAITMAEKQLITELTGFEKYDPYNQDYRGWSGYCILNLRLALWALYWSFQDGHPAIPKWLPEWIFETHGFDVIMWIVVIGADADTNAATAGPLLAAFHPIPENFLTGLKIRKENENYFK